MLSEPVCIAGILRQPVQPFHSYPLTARASHSPLLNRQVETLARSIGVLHTARPAVVDGPVPSSAARAHGGFSPNHGDQPGVGIAKDPLQPTAGQESWKREHRGERLGIFHRSSWTTTARSLPQISDKIRALAVLDQTQSG